MYIYICMCSSQGGSAEASDKGDEKEEYVRPTMTTKLEVTCGLYLSLLNPAFLLTAFISSYVSSNRLMRRRYVWTVASGIDGMTTHTQNTRTQFPPYVQRGDCDHNLFPTHLCELLFFTSSNIRDALLDFQYQYYFVWRHEN